MRPATRICSAQLAKASIRSYSASTPRMAPPSAPPQFTHVSLAKHPSPSNVYILTLQRAPENRLNSVICQDVIKALHHVQAIVPPESPAALVTTTDSHKFFSTGLDFDEADEHPWSMADGFYPMLAAVLEFPFPTVACVTGHSFGGGCPLALAHDYRVMNSKRGFWSMPPVDIGVSFAGIGALPRLKLRPQVARSMLLEAKRWTGEQAHADGIVDEIAPPQEMLQRAVAIAEKWAPKARYGVYGELRHELYGEVSDKLRTIAHVRRRDVQERPKIKL